MAWTPTLARDRYAIAEESSGWNGATFHPRTTGVAFPTRPEREAAKAESVAKGLLDEAGEITATGRACEREGR